MELTEQAALTQERQTINHIDAQIADLLAARFEHVATIAALKEKAAVPTLNAARETQVLDAVGKAVGDPALAPHARRIFAAIMAESRDYQEAQRHPQLKKA